ncbi:hypothetical protein O3G_MSEX001720 [Manduca sexta]|nr:hypothetical protein O3G_MSEX001720 [Manduca sexta]
MTGYTDYEVMVKPDFPSFILDVLSKIIGHKISALNCAVSIIEWVVSNFFVIMLGATSVLGLCKLTSKCNMMYEVPSVTQIQSYVTPDRLETAQRFLITAVEQYAQKRKRNV